MENVLRLPAETRKCPVCGNTEMRATRAGLGGGWTHTGLQFVFSCAACGHQTVIERRGTRRSEAGAGLALVILCVIVVLAVDGLGILGGVVAAVFALMGIGTIVAALAPDTRYPVTGALPENEVSSVSVEEHLYLSDEEREQGKVWDRRATVAAYAVVAVTAVWLLWSSFAD